MNKTIGIMGAVVVVVGGVWYVLSRPSPAVDVNGMPPEAANSQVPAALAPSGAGSLAPETPSTPAGMTRNITVTGQSFSFSPSTITVKKGTVVTLTFKNADGFHDFKIDEFNVATPRINGGQEATVTFTADKVGSFEYYCSVGNHRAMGMKGTLTVTE